MLKIKLSFIHSFNHLFLLIANKVCQVKIKPPLTVHYQRLCLKLMWYDSLCTLHASGSRLYRISVALTTLNTQTYPRDPYSFFLKVVSRASIPKNMLALAKFWLPFQKWRIIGKKRRQNGYMLKNLCVFLLTSYDASLQYM